MFEDVRKSLTLIGASSMEGVEVDLRQRFLLRHPLENLKIGGELVSVHYTTMYSLTIDSDDYDSISKTLVEPLVLRTGTQDQLVKGAFLEATRAGAGSYTLAMPKGSLSKPSAIDGQKFFRSTRKVSQSS